MGRLYLCVQYNGEWKMSDNGVWEWIAGRSCKGFTIERSLKMEEFVDKICEQTGINKNEYSIEVTHKCPGDINNKTQPIPICNDLGMEDFFILYEEEKAVTVYVEVKAIEKAICLVDNDVGDDFFGLAVQDMISRREELFGCYGRPLQICRGRTTNVNEPEIGSNTTPTPVNVEMATPTLEWNQEVGDGVNSPPAIELNEENDDAEVHVVGNRMRLDGDDAEIHLESTSITNNDEADNNEFVEEETTATHSTFQTDPSDHANRRHDGSDLAQGQHFETKWELNYKLNLVAIQGKFEMKVYKSTTTLKEVRCVDDKCSWRVRALKKPPSNFFVIRHYNGFHTCTMMTRSVHHKQATSRVIGTRMHGHFKCTKTPPKPKMLVEFVRNELELQCSYWKAWKAKKFAQDLIRGTAEHNFAILPSYCYMLKKVNEGTVTHIEVDKENRFKYFFMALGAQIRGFRVMRKVIGIDGAWIKTKFKGVLLVASTQDSEFHSYPLAWGLVDSENNASWIWFLEKLKELIPDETELCFISDRNKSIEHAVELVYPQVNKIINLNRLKYIYIYICDSYLRLSPQATHGACSFHVKMNIKHKFRSCASLVTYNKAAEAYTVHEFNKHFSELRGTFPRVAKYLEEEVKIEKWSRANFKGNRYEVMTTNIVETVNHMMNEAREYPITALIDFVLETMGQWFMERRAASLTMENLQITPKREAVLRERWNIACSLTPMQLNVHEYYVKCGEHEAVVNLSTRSCECKVFDVEGIPCVHAISAAGLRQPLNTGELIYSYCSKYYSVDYFLHAYAETIYPVTRESQWDNIPEEISSIIVREPIIKESTKGRPRMSRFPSRGESLPKKKYRCSECNTLGHTRRKCTKSNQDING